jgi:MoxR-like ATPase
MKRLAELKAKLAEAAYIADDTLATALQLALDLGRPLLLEGEAGVGKTEIAKALASCLDTKLIRLQCYEGLDAAAAIYEWNYQRQLPGLASKRWRNRFSPRNTCWSGPCSAPYGRKNLLSC